MLGLAEELEKAAVSLRTRRDSKVINLGLEPGDVGE